MRDEYTKDDVCDIKKNPYVDKFTREEKLKAMLECFLATEKIDKEELKKEVDLILS